MALGRFPPGAIERFADIANLRQNDLMSQGFAGGLGGLGQLQQGGAIGGLASHGIPPAPLAPPAMYRGERYNGQDFASVKHKPEGIREELQEEINEWLSDI